VISELPIWPVLAELKSTLASFFGALLCASCSNGHGWQSVIFCFSRRADCDMVLTGLGPLSAILHPPDFPIRLWQSDSLCPDFSVSWLVSTSKSGAPDTPLFSGRFRLAWTITDSEAVLINL